MKQGSGDINHTHNLCQFLVSVVPPRVNYCRAVHHNHPRPASEVGRSRTTPHHPAQPSHIAASATLPHR